jgi:hypothetical protein
MEKYRDGEVDRAEVERIEARWLQIYIDSGLGERSQGMQEILFLRDIEG